MAKLLKIALPEDHTGIQAPLFAPLKKPGPWPQLDTGENHVRDIIDDVAHLGAGAVGLDLEYDSRTSKPSIIGLALPLRAAACHWSPDLASRIVFHARQAGAKLVGHAVITADKPLIDAALGSPTRLSDWSDTLIKHYLLNADWCKMPGGQKDDDEDEDAAAVGFMNLYSMAVTYLDLPQWKHCRGLDCCGPCPVHRVFDYCATDAWAGVMADPIMDRLLAEWRVPPQLYNDLLELSEICYRMQQHGIAVDLAWVEQLERHFEQAKERLFRKVTVGDDEWYVSGRFDESHYWALVEDRRWPDARDYLLGHVEFNPRSPQQVVQFFKQQGVDLDNAEKDTLYKALEKRFKRAGYATLKDLESDSDQADEVLDKLYRAWQYKASGKGLKSWFNRRHIAAGLLHPRFDPCGTSSGRLSSAGPNFQNIPARGFGALVRRAIRARNGFHLVKADSSQLELRTCLYAAGVDPSIAGTDAFTWLAAEVGIDRTTAKSVSHASDYMEGLRILYPDELDTAHTKRAIAAGALKVFHDWSYRGGLVAFTGANLADRLFGDHTFENRKRALEIQEKYFGRFPQLREWHRRMLAEVEHRHFVRLPTGRFLRLYGSAEDDAKIACAIQGQGIGAEYIIGVMLRYNRELATIPLAQVHDELLFERPEAETAAQARDFIRLMGEETPRLPGFKAPFKAFCGGNWLERSADNPAGYAPL